MCQSRSPRSDSWGTGKMENCALLSWKLLLSFVGHESHSGLKTFIILVQGNKLQSCRGRDWAQSCGKITHIEDRSLRYSDLKVSLASLKAADDKDGLNFETRSLEAGNVLSGSTKSTSRRARRFCKMAVTGLHGELFCKHRFQSWWLLRNDYRSRRKSTYMSWYRVEWHGRGVR